MPLKKGRAGLGGVVLIMSRSWYLWFTCQDLLRGMLTFNELGKRSNARLAKDFTSFLQGD